MECIKEKRFLFWKYQELIHDFEIISINKFMSCSDTFHVHYECKGCGLEKTDKFVEPDELIIKGIPPKELNNINCFRWYPKK